MKKEKQYEEEYVKLNGVSHYLLHYRSKKEEPVILFIHGGPGTTEAMMAPSASSIFTLLNSRALFTSMAYS